MVPSESDGIPVDTAAGEGGPLGATLGLPRIGCSVPQRRGPCRVAAVDWTRPGAGAPGCDLKAESPRPGSGDGPGAIVYSHTRSRAGAVAVPRSVAGVDASRASQARQLARGRLSCCPASGASFLVQSRLGCSGLVRGGGGLHGGAPELGFEGAQMSRGHRMETAGRDGTPAASGSPGPGHCVPSPGALGLGRPGLGRLPSPGSGRAWGLCSGHQGEG